MLSQQQKELIKATIPVLRENGVALTGYFYNRMLTNNPELKETFNLGHQRSGAQAKALAGAVLAYAENIDNPGVLASAIELISHKHVSLNIQAPDYSIVGENLLHSISEVLNVPMESELIAAWAAAYGQLADILIGAEKALYTEHEQTEGSWLGWRTFIIDKKVQESDEITSFYLVPKDGGALPTYQPGQYVSVRVFVPELGLKQPRQYSLSDSPSKDYFRISVKREGPKEQDQKPGYVSNTLHQLSEKSEIELSAPTGNFFLINPARTNVLISAGVGLTPMVSMLNQLLGEQQAAQGDTQPPVHFIHAVRGAPVHAMKAHIQALRQENDQLKTLVAYEHVNAQDVAGQDYDVQGRLDLSSIDEQWLPKDADYYLCGPMPFMKQQHQALLQRGIPQQNIHSEAFGTGGVAL